jgi:mannitol/fructose-specific phosphotransferase system IIA component (Ntr-type)
MRISGIIQKSAIKLQLESTGKQDVLKELVDLLCGAYGLGDRDKILDAIIRREEKQSTGIGMGLAVPHAKTEGVDRLYICAGLSAEGIDFDSVDGEESRIFFLLVSPLDVSGPHIKALAGISRLIKHRKFRSALLECGSTREFIKKVKEAEKKYL